MKDLIERLEAENCKSRRLPLMNWQPIETWAPVSGYVDRYEISSFGGVRRCDGFIVGQWHNHNGNLCVRLSSPRKTLRVHRMIAAAFIPNPNAKPYVNHIDCARDNNRVENLEWCTQLENIRHSERLGRMQRDYWVGRRSASAALTDEQVRAIRAEYAQGALSWASLGKHYAISKRSIGRIINRESYVDVR